jgi:deoxyribodipyrimidine photo-lyase
VSSPAPVPDSRLRTGNDQPLRPDRDFVLYWMTAFRRLDWHYGLQRAVGLAHDLRRPLVILEGLRCDYPWASDRIHRFVLQGMADHAQRLRRGRVYYYPYVEPTPGAGRGLLRALARRACAVVGDDWPGFFHPRLLAAASGIPARLELVDAAGLFPARAAPRAFPTAHAFRRFLQRELPRHLTAGPEPRPLVARLPSPMAPPQAILERWPAADLPGLLGRGGLASLPIDHEVSRVVAPGGARAAVARLSEFLEDRLAGYADHRNDPSYDGASGLSPYLHFGHVGSHHILYDLAEQEEWHPGRAGPDATGSREGWWGMSRAAEAFLDQLVTWRELGLNAAAHDPAYERFDSLPAWARRTLDQHAADRRKPCYTRDELAAAATHDPLWNAAQRQLVTEGTIQGYLRMLWGKKILEWSPDPEVAFETMVRLNNRYALDGRDPNSYSGILWCLGKFDRPWGPERAVFGTVRYMSSENTARKFKIRGYLERYAALPSGGVEC